MNWNLVADFTFGTSNRAELAAAVLAIKSILKTRERVIIFSDSKYVIRGATDWINKWRKENWKSHKGQTIANVELWIQLSELLFQRAVTWQHVRAHRNCLGNNIADKACKLCWKTNDRIELSGINKSEHTIHDLVERRLHDIQRRLRRG